jgi:hypothetical protein
LTRISSVAHGFLDPLQVERYEQSVEVDLRFRLLAAGNVRADPGDKLGEGLLAVFVHRSYFKSFPPVAARQQTNNRALPGLRTTATVPDAVGTRSGIGAGVGCV